jgi:predicted transcriptional regulator
MDCSTVTFRIRSELEDVFDAIAESMDRDRSYALNKAIEACLDTQRWQIEHISEGVRQADAREFATDSEVAAAFARWRR